jgi:hypothetical protein
MEAMLTKVRKQHLDLLAELTTALRRFCDLARMSAVPPPAIPAWGSSTGPQCASIAIALARDVMHRGTIVH